MGRRAIPHGGGVPGRAVPRRVPRAAAPAGGRLRRPHAAPAALDGAPARLSTRCVDPTGQTVCKKASECVIAAVFVTEAPLVRRRGIGLGRAARQTIVWAALVLAAAESSFRLYAGVVVFFSSMPGHFLVFLSAHLLFRGLVSSGLGCVYGTALAEATAAASPSPATGLPKLSVQGMPAPTSPASWRHWPAAHLNVNARPDERTVPRRLAGGPMTAVSPETLAEAPESGAHSGSGRSSFTSLHSVEPELVESRSGSGTRPPRSRWTSARICMTASRSRRSRTSRLCSSGLGSRVKGAIADRMGSNRAAASVVRLFGWCLAGNRTSERNLQHGGGGGIRTHERVAPLAVFKFARSRLQASHSGGHSPTKCLHVSGFWSLPR